MKPFSRYFCSLLIKMKHQEWLETLNMLPISHFVYTKRNMNMNDEIVDWSLFDVYRVAPQFPLEIRKFGHIFNESTNADYTAATGSPSKYIDVDKIFYNKSSRDDLKGLKIRCGLAVSRLCLLG